MELEELIRELGSLIDEADLAADGGNVDGARELLRTAKSLLDAEFRKD
jgi:hypothetical protein